jgi:hypothetical protein
LQDPAINFENASIEALENELKDSREDLCIKAIQNAKIKCNQWGIEIERRTRRRRNMRGELSRDAGLSAEEEIIRTMKSVLDRLLQEMTTRFTRLKDLNSKFGFLLDITALFNEKKSILVKIAFGLVIFTILMLMVVNCTTRLWTARCCYAPEKKNHQRRRYIFLTL